MYKTVKTRDKIERFVSHWLLQRVERGAEGYGERDRVNRKDIHVLEKRRRGGRHTDKQAEAWQPIYLGRLWQVLIITDVTVSPSSKFTRPPTHDATPSYAPPLFADLSKLLYTNAIPAPAFIAILWKVVGTQDEDEGVKMI